MHELATGIGIERVMRAIAWLGLAHGLWMGLAAPAIAALVLRVWPGLRGAARHRIVLGAFLLATIGPFVVGAAHREVARRSARGPVGAVTISVAPEAEAQAAERSVDRRDVRPRGVDRPSPRRLLARWASEARPWLLACWASGLAGMVGLLGLGMCASRRLLRQCRPAPGPVEREARRLGRGMGLRRCPPVLVHDSVSEPCLCGIVRPSIILPADWLDEARPGVVSAVLAHELAHARRRDPLTNLIHHFLEALVLFHPGARRLSWTLRLQREHRADALAVRLTGDPRGLAEALEGFARIRLAPRSDGLLRASLGGESSTLLPRIQEILDMTSKPERIGFWTVVNLPVAGLLALAITTSGLARDEPAAKAPAAPRFEAMAAPPIAGKPWEEQPMISYEVRLLEVDDLFGIDFDFSLEIGEEGERVSLAFLSELEQGLLIEAVSRSPSDRMIQAPKVTSFEGASAIIRFPHEPGRDLDVDAPATTVEVSGTIAAETREHIKLSILLTDDHPGAGHRDREEAEGRQVRVTVPNGGTVILSTDDPAEVEARGRRRMIMVTPRRIVTEEEERSLLQQPGAVFRPSLRFAPIE